MHFYISDYISDPPWWKDMYGYNFILEEWVTILLDYFSWIIFKQVQM